MGAGERVDYRWQWPLGYGENLARGNLPPPRLLVPARRAIALASIALLVAAAWLAPLPGAARWAATFVPLVILTLPSYLAHAAHAYVDLPQLALALPGLGALLLAARRGSLRWTAVAALLLGASCAVKLSSGAFVAGGVAALLALPGISWPRRAAHAALCGGLALALFVAVNPYLHRDPLTRLRGIVEGWNARKLQQAGDPRLERGRVSRARDGLGILAQRAVLRPALADLSGSGPSAPLRGAASALVVVTLLAGRELRRGAGSRDRRSTMERAALGGAILLAWGLEATVTGSVGAFAVPVLAGLAALAASWRAGAPRAWLVIWATSFVITGLWLPFDWAVYALPVRIATVPVWALGVTAMARLSLRATEPEPPWGAALAALLVILQLAGALASRG